jgi:hypothetical protein
MPITPFLAGQAFDPETTCAMSRALDKACESLGLRVGKDPATEVIAAKIVELAQRGVRDADTLCERVLKEVSLDR